jgi:hypothetical protein
MCSICQCYNAEQAKKFLNKKRSPPGTTFPYEYLKPEGVIGLAAGTIATETSAHITTTSGRCARGKCSCYGEGKGEDHDNLSHCKRYLNVKVNCLVKEEFGPGNSEEGRM